MRGEIVRIFNFGVQFTIKTAILVYKRRILHHLCICGLLIAVLEISPIHQKILRKGDKEIAGRVTNTNKVDLTPFLIFDYSVAIMDMYYLQQEQQERTKSVEGHGFNNVVDGNVLNNLLSMRSGDLRNLLKMMEGDGNGEGKANNLDEDGKLVNDCLIQNNDEPVIKLIDSRNSGSFAKLFSMKNADFQKLFTQAGVDAVETNTTQGKFPNNTSTQAYQESVNEDISRMTSDELLNWIWSLEEDNLDAILNVHEGQQVQPQYQKHRKGVQETFVSDVTGQGQSLSDQNQRKLSRKLSDIYFGKLMAPGTDAINDVSKEKGLGAHQLQLLLQHKGFLARRAQQKMQNLGIPSPVTMDPNQPQLFHDSSVGTKTASMIYEDILKEQQEKDMQPLIEIDTQENGVNADTRQGTFDFRDMHVDGNAFNEEKGLVGSLAVALGHKTHNSLYVKKELSNDRSLEPSMPIRKRCGRKTKEDSESEEIDETDLVAVARRNRRRERRAKNKESAAKSRAKKRNYTQGLETIINDLRKENEVLKTKYRKVLEGSSSECRAVSDESEPDFLAKKREKLLMHYLSLPKDFKL